MISIVMNITCLYCFKTFRSTGVMYRCQNPSCSGRQEDHVFAKNRDLRKAPIFGRAYHPTQLTWKDHILRSPKPIATECDICHQKSSVRLCPICHFELLPDAGMVDDHIISIIGGRGAGKGHFITTLVHRLKNEVGKQFNISVKTLEDGTWHRFKNDYHDPLFRRHSVIQPTQSSQIDPQTKTPMIFRLVFNGHFRSRGVNMVFFDSAGEDMKSLDVLSAQAKYICYSSGIVFLLDPLQIDKVRQVLSSEPLPDRDPTTEPSYLLERLIELFEQNMHLSANSKVKTPVAFTVSKTDMLNLITDSKSVLKTNGAHFGHFNQEDARSVQVEILNFLQYYINTGFSNRAQLGFSKFHYFGVSSLGSSPINGKIGRISPVRVEDPILWILNELGLIKKSK